MKRALLITVALLSMQLSFSQETTMTNNSVVEMVEMGLDDEIVVSKIENSTTAFDVSLEALKDIKAKNVSSAIISAMIKRTSAEMKSKADKTGIYYISADSTEVTLMPTAFAATKTRTLASAFTYGIASGKIKSVINGESSKNTINTAKPTFTFYFAKFGANQQLVSDWWFRVTTAPTEFALVILTQKKGKRELETGKANMWVGTDSGVRNDDVIACDIQDLGNGKFTVTPKQDLPKGEYCFFYCGTIPQGGYTNQSVFDFSVK